MSKKYEVTEKQKENKLEDKKALGKFSIIMIFAFVAGIVIGVGSSVVNFMVKEWMIKETFVNLVRAAAIYGGYVYTTALGIVCVVLHKKSRKEYMAWDEENEETLASMETKLSYIGWFGNLIMYGAYFFFSVGVWALDILNIVSATEQNGTAYWISLGAVFFHMAYALITSVVIQQKAINLLKEINPEKKGSVYDMKFQDKWLANCDEAERFTAYKCSFKTNKTMQMVGLVLWLVCLVGQIIFNTGVFATLIVTIYLIIQTSVYNVQGIYFAKHPSEVMK